MTFAVRTTQRRGGLGSSPVVTVYLSQAVTAMLAFKCVISNSLESDMSTGSLAHYTGALLRG